MNIQSEILSLNITKQIDKSSDKVANSVRKMSSGLDVEKAADNPAGLAARDLMRSNVDAYNQGIRNANDAVSMVQVAEGSTSVINDNLIRMKELSVQASSGTYNADQRAIIDQEYQMLSAEVSRIAESTEFNGIKLLDGSASGTHTGTGGDGAIRIHFGTGNDSSEDYYDVSIDSLKADDLGISNSLLTQGGAAANLENLDKAITQTGNVRASLGSTQNRLESTVDNLSIQTENTQNAESRISDVDMAKEVTKYTLGKILSESSTAMQSQVNSLSKSFNTKMYGF